MVLAGCWGSNSQWASALPLGYTAAGRLRQPLFLLGDPACFLLHIQAGSHTWLREGRGTEVAEPRASPQGSRLLYLAQRQCYRGCRSPVRNRPSSADYCKWDLVKISKLHNGSGRMPD